MNSNSTAKIRDLDLIAYLLHEGFQPLGNPVIDTAGVRYAIFQNSPELKQATFSFISGNPEAQLLADFRKARSFLLDSQPVKEITRGYDANSPH